MALPEIIQELLESGVHFGHLSKHWNPKMKRFIFGKKKNVYIIDLEKTAQKLDEAKDFLKERAKLGDKILFVATKKQLRGSIKEMANSCDMPYVVERWVGGLLTNFSTVRSRVNKYVSLLDKKEKDGFGRIPRKELTMINREIERMEKSYSGVAKMMDLPDCVFVIDPKKETACIREATKLSIPIVSLLDTDANPDIIDYPIPGNDDSIKSVKCIVEHLVAAIKEGQEKSPAPAEEAKEGSEAAESGSEEVKAEPREEVKEETTKEGEVKNNES